MINLFKKNAFIALLCFGLPLFAQTNKVDTIKEGAVLGEQMPREHQPKSYELFEINFENFNNYLLNAPDEFDANASQFLVNLPDADGKLATYVVYKSEVFEKELADKYPGIYSYKGYNIKEPANNFRMAVSYIHGVHLMGRSAKGETYYMDTYTKDLNTYILYKRKDLEAPKHHLNCETESEGFATQIGEENVAKQLTQYSRFKKYRLAMACTVEYAQFHISASFNMPHNTIAQKKAIVLSAMNVTVNRVNQVYENDLSVRLVLIGNNDQLIFINQDNFSNNNALLLIDESQNVIDAKIGNSNYDIGHTVSTGGGGLAQLGIVCTSPYKAMGITGLFSPVGDAYDIDFVAHEMGHQFGAQHTFNGNTGSCQGNANPATAAEPGSGTTIMAYAGICNLQNVQYGSDPYFHYYSLENIYDAFSGYYVSSFYINTSNCAVTLAQSNAVPTVSTQGTKSIPKGTPFRLTAMGADDNNPNTLTYCWEQLDTEFINYPISNTNTVGPAFRSSSPSNSATRYFPALTTVLAGYQYAAQTPSSTWEVLPKVARTMRFGVTVRDNNPQGGGAVKRATQTINVKNVGPFYLTYPNNVVSGPSLVWDAGSTKTITWNVGGTTSNGINTSHVNILYTEDNGQTFHTIVENVPNDGNQEIVVPTNLADQTQIRILVEPVNNVYYAISKKIVINAVAGTEQFNFDEFKLYPNPTSDTFVVSFVPENSNEVTYSIFDGNGRTLLEGVLENKEMIKEEISLRGLASGVYFIKITNGNKSTTQKVIKK